MNLNARCSNGCVRGGKCTTLVFEYPVICSVWHNILVWLNLSSALHNFAVEKFYQFAGLLGSGRVRLKGAVLFSSLVYGCFGKIATKFFSTKTKKYLSTPLAKFVSFRGFEHISFCGFSTHVYVYVSEYKDLTQICNPLIHLAN